VAERISKRRVDIAAAVLVGVIALGNALHFDHFEPFVVLPILVATAALVSRRSHPLAVLGVVSVSLAVAIAAGSSAVFPIALVASYSVAEFAPRRLAVRAALVAAVPPAAVLLVVDGFDDASSHLPGLFFLATAWAIGDNRRVRREREEESARQAIADERARIARELHDVVTHNVSVMVVQAAAGNDVFDERPDQARAALQAVEQTGREALGELRRLLDVVSGGNAPQPGLDRLDALVAQVRRAGVEVELTIEGTPRELPAALDLSAYRIVQESLTNMLNHARASRATVRVAYTDGAVELEIADDGVGAASTEGGRGLVGMRERAAVFHGELHAGTRPGGGFAVRAKLPVEAV
jgi:signal transduction histidine kinase